MAIHVVGAAVVHEGRCLVAQRGPHMSLAGKWEFPGGKVERGERPEQALARELGEELGCEVQVGSRLGCGQARDDATVVTLEVFAATLVAGTPRAREHAAIAWLGPDELGLLDWAEADRPIVPAVIAMLRQPPA